MSSINVADRRNNMLCAIQASSLLPNVGEQIISSPKPACRFGRGNSLSGVGSNSRAGAW